MAKKKFLKRKKRKIYKRFIEIKSNRNGWTIVELVSINTDGTLTIRTIDGHVIKRKWGKRMRWAISSRKERECGMSPTF